MRDNSRIPYFIYCLSLILGCCFLIEVASAKDPVDCINPFIGTGHFGKTFPGAALPGGMVQLSPDTVTGGDNGSGYRYYHSTIEGLSVNHMSGVGWYGDLGNFLVTPTIGPLQTWWGETGKPGTGYLSTFSHDTEVAQAGYYAVTFADPNVRAEVTVTPHAGLLRFGFPDNAASRVQIDLARRVGGTSLHQTVGVTDDHTIEGQIDCTPEGGGWGHGRGDVRYTLYYQAEFSRPFGNFGVWSSTLPPGKHNDVLEKPEFIAACRHAQILPGCKAQEGQHLGFYAEFATQAAQPILLKVGISYVSLAGARANLAAEIPAWDFDGVRAQARAAWARALDSVAVAGGTDDQKAAFYTALYHALLYPQIFADVDGTYPGGDGKPHQAQGFTKRTMFSGWDVYRSEFPLLTLIRPDIVNDLLNSFVELAQQNKEGVFDRWEFFNAYTGCMNGNPAVVVLNDAYQKGIRGYDVGQAYTIARATCEKNGNGPRGYSTGHHGLSVTLECANDDWNLSRLAASLGHTDDSAKYAKRGLDYGNVFDASAPWTYDASGKEANPNWHGWFRPRADDGSWMPWDGLLSGKGVQEASIFQQGWFVPFDVPGLIKLQGGPDLFVQKLSVLFDRAPDVSTWSGPNRKGSNEVLTPYYNQPNEPVHLIPFLFNRAGAPWLTQKWIRTIDRAYQNGPEGLCGDEDVGQMSAWFVLAASGLHQACPGDTRFEIFTPLFDQVTLRLAPKYAKGGTFTITARNNSPKNIYIQSAMLNGAPLNRCWLDYSEITAGGKLDLVLGPEPNKRWGL